MKFHIELYIPARVITALMMFLACWVNYMMRVNMSVIIIAMVPERTHTSGKSEPIVANGSSLHNLTMVPKQEKQAIGQTFDWSVHQQAHVLGSYFWGYTFTCLVGGPAAEYWGPRKLIFCTMLISSILTFLSPAAAKIHYLALLGVRCIIGLAGGSVYPALHALLAHWAPPAEKGKFVSAMLGGAIGTVFTWTLSGPIITNLGWDFAFYVQGAIALGWCFLWWYLVYDSPVHHPRIDDGEKKYILDALGDKVVHGARMAPPLKAIFTSFPFLAMMVLHFGSNWGLYVMLTAAPKFVATALGFNLTSAGTLSSMPYLARMIFSLIFGTIGDRIIKKKLLTLTVMRKFFCIFSHVIPGLFLVTLAYTRGSPILSVIIITLTLGSNGAATLTNLVNHQDLAPNFAGTLYGIANGICTSAGFLTPVVTAHFTKHGTSFEDWRPVFLVGASMYIGTALYFMVFGTSATQPWNVVKPRAN